MRTEQVKKILKDHNIPWAEFEEWLDGQTVSMYPNGDTNYFEYDLERFCKGASPMSHG